VIHVRCCSAVDRAFAIEALRSIRDPKKSYVLRKRPGLGAVAFRPSMINGASIHRSRPRGVVYDSLALGLWPLPSARYFVVTVSPSQLGHSFSPNIGALRKLVNVIPIALITPPLLLRTFVMKVGESSGPFSFQKQPLLATSVMCLQRFGREVQKLYAGQVHFAFDMLPFHETA
jgi:hypothetical protein